MVFGKRTQDKKKWHPAYAWWPVRLLDGRWAWLEKVDKIDYWSDEIQSGSICSWFDEWCFRLPVEE